MFTLSQATPIGDCVDDISTWNPVREVETKKFRYVDISSISQSEKKIVPNGEILSTNAPSRARQIIRARDVLVATVRPNLNAVAIVQGELDGAIASTGFCVLRPKTNALDKRYLFHWVKTPSFVTDMSRQATGQSYPAVSDRIVKNSLIPLPPLKEQRRIAAILDAADALRVKQRFAIAKVEDLMQSMISSLLIENADESSQVTLNSIVSSHRHSFVNGPFGSDLLTSELFSHGVPVIYIRDIRNGEYRRVSDVHVTNEKAAKLAFWRCPAEC